MINLLPTPPLTSGHHLLHNLLSIKWGGTPESLRSVSNLSILIDSQNQHQNKKKIAGYIKKPHTTIFTGPTGCGKTHLV